MIAQHYNFIFGQDSACVAAWCDHVASLAESASSQHQLVTVEGYLLEPALDAVHERLAGMADVTTVVARIRRYYKTAGIQEIHTIADDSKSPR